VATTAGKIAGFGCDEFVVTVGNTAAGFVFGTSASFVLLLASLLLLLNKLENMLGAASAWNAPV
jgi:hypothetical protein